MNNRYAMYTHCAAAAVRLYSLATDDILTRRDQYLEFVRAQLADDVTIADDEEINLVCDLLIAMCPIFDRDN